MRITAFRRVVAVCSFLLFASAGASAVDTAQLREASGVVQVQSAGAEGWVLVRKTPFEIASGDRLRTGYGAHAEIQCTDGSRLQVGSNATLTMVHDSRYRVELSLEQGPLQISSQADPLRSFQLRTPTAVALLRAIRAEVSLEVRLGGLTVIDLHRGLLGVEDRHGAAVLLHPNERLEIDASGMGNPNLMPTAVQAKRMRFHERMQRELALDLGKENEQSSAARERKLEEYQQGKSLIDLSGNRVRVEEFMLRPAPDQFKLVVLNGRASGLSYFYTQGTFNQSLPENLSVPFAQLSGRAGAAPDYWLTGFQTGRSNGRDSVVEIGQLGHPVDVNNDGEPGDIVTWLFNANTNGYDNVAGQSVYRTLFDRYGLYVNGALKYGWAAGVAVRSSADQQAALVSTHDPFTGALLAALPARSVTTTFPEAGQAYRSVYEAYGDGTFLRWDSTSINTAGHAVGTGNPAGSFAVPGSAGFLGSNFEETVTASEFGGRSIDLVIAPKILVRSGLLP